ncbi:MAG: SPFH domain-containing protein [Microscillaceae bacterium]|nr:SPFH domain-containing protein [Microscillaceae bacterium]MDW8459686.1 SPFH domain-containing protein [Cytophagales bacterium]
MKAEKEFTPISGYGMLFIALILLVAPIACFVLGSWFIGIGIILSIVFFIFISGFFIIEPNGSKVMVFFGEYRGTVKTNGFFWANPFFTKKAISLRARNLESEKLKVNDKLGNPIMIGVILVWRVKDTFKASFEVDNYENFVKTQTEAAIRVLASQYSYDNFDDDHTEVTLRSGTEEVNHALEDQLRERLNLAGVEIIEARIGYLAYAAEIANAMLRRQQAAAVLAARQKIVEGAVSMVEMALKELSKKEVVNLDEERKAAMVSNLMVVLCSDKDVSPVVNTGSLY